MLEAENLPVDNVARRDRGANDLTKPRHDVNALALASAFTHHHRLLRPVLLRPSPSPPPPLTKRPSASGQGEPDDDVSTNVHPALVSSSFSGASRKGIAFEAFIVIVDATGAGARETADPAKAERLITGVAATKAYMMTGRGDRRGEEGGKSKWYGRAGREWEGGRRAESELGMMVAIEVVRRADVKRRARGGGQKRRRKDLRCERLAQQACRGESARGAKAPGPHQSGLGGGCAQLRPSRLPWD